MFGITTASRVLRQGKLENLVVPRYAGASFRCGSSKKDNFPLIVSFVNCNTNYENFFWNTISLFKYYVYILPILSSRKTMILYLVWLSTPIYQQKPSVKCSAPYPLWFARRLLVVIKLKLPNSLCSSQDITQRVLCTIPRPGPWWMLPPRTPWPWPYSPSWSAFMMCKQFTVWVIVWLWYHT